MRSFRSSIPAARAGGFTLVELLVVVGITAILGALVFSGASAAIQAAHRTREMVAARSLITAYLTAASDNNGELLPGYDFGANNLTAPDGTKLSPQVVCERYPFRLAPYFNYDLDGTVLVNNTKQQIEQIAPAGSSMHNYLISVFPAFGMNSYFVGGERTLDGPASYPKDCVTTLPQGGSSLLVFASAGTGEGAARVDGYFRITPPTLSSWSSVKWTPDIDPGSYGNVDGRYNGKAVCAFLDGSVSVLSIDQLRDMRLWDKAAIEQNDPNFSDFQ